MEEVLNSLCKLLKIPQLWLDILER